VLVATVEIVLAVLLGIGFAIVLARLALGGVLAIAFARARTFVKRMAERRAAAQAVDVNRRSAERRAG
jgi:hypothetical protein